MESIQQHLINRHLDFNLHKLVVVDEVERIATFYLTNGVGTITGYQQYRPDRDKARRNDPKDGRYYTYRLKSTIAFFGIESYHFRNDILFVTEGIFDAVRLTELKQPAFALLSNDPSWDIRNYLGCLPRKVIAICDDDKAGRKLAKCGDTSIVIKDGDLGDASDEFVIGLIEKTL